MMRFLPARRSLENPLNRRFPHSLKFYSYYDTIILVHRRLADPEFLRRLPYCRIMVYDVIGNGNCPFFDIFLHEAASENVFYIILIVRRNYAWLNSALLYAWNQYDTVLKKSFVSIFFLSPPHVYISASRIHMPPLNDPFYQCRACRWCRRILLPAAFPCYESRYNLPS